MYIVLENALTDALRSKYLLLELDTLKIQDQVIKSFCVIDNAHTPLNEIPQLEAKKQLHTELMENFRQQNWDDCDTAIGVLLGSFRGEADTFYDHLSKRIAMLRHETLPADWDGAVETAES